MKLLKKFLVGLLILLIVLQSNTVFAKEYDYAWLTELKDAKTNENFYVYSFFEAELRTDIVAHHYTGDYSAQIYYVLEEVSSIYNELDKDLLEAIIWQESNYNPYSKLGTCYGLMQINDCYHRGRASKLLIPIYSTKDWYNINTNIKVGADLFWDILCACDGNETKALMMYNMGNRGATLYDNGVISSYAKSVLQKRDIIKEERLRGEDLWLKRIAQIQQKSLDVQLEQQKQEKLV